MTVLWVSICRNDMGFPIRFRMSSKIRKTGPSGVEKFPRQVQPLSSDRARLAGHVRDRHLCFFMGSLIRLVLHELFGLYIGKIDDRVSLGMKRWINATIGCLSISVHPLYGELLGSCLRSTSRLHFNVFADGTTLTPVQARC